MVADSKKHLARLATASRPRQRGSGSWGDSQRSAHARKARLESDVAAAVGVAAAVAVAEDGSATGRLDDLWPIS